MSRLEFGLLWRHIQEVRRERPEATWGEQAREIRRRMDFCGVRFLNGRSQATCTLPAGHTEPHRAEHPLSSVIVNAMNTIVRESDRRGVGVEVIVRLTRADGRVCESRQRGKFERIR